MNKTNDLPARMGAILAALRASPPLIQVITNYVTVNDVANALLCLGASPAMVEAENEAASFARLASALYLNVGTLSAEQARAMPRALTIARERGIPVVLDPVACGAFAEKMDYVRGLLQAGGISIIKGNAAEILSLAGMEARSRGVDSLESGTNVGQACQFVANHYRAVVMASGEVDTVSDGVSLWAITGGHPLLARVSGTGCVLGGLVAAMTVASRALGGGDADGCLAAAAVFGLAAQRAATDGRIAGPSSFRTAVLDGLDAVQPDDLSSQAAKHLITIEQSDAQATK
jgi:hydroxyethylthiazole kinase